MTDTAYVFAKTFVHDLDAMGKFYSAVFGLVENNRHSDVMLGREIVEITYKPSAGREAGGLTLISYLDGNGPAAGEAVQGFITQDIEAVCERARAAGGSVPEPIRDIAEFGIRVAFVLDPEGHINEVIQMTAS
ncbi:MAG: VOC family protein [Novosphingobium sp.]|nr:VOC family protein [Novosphingobium sp.]